MSGGEYVKNVILSISGVVGSCITYLIGGWAECVTVLLIFMVIDYITGVIVAGVFHKSPKTKTGTLESKTHIKGLFRKLTIFSFIILANLLDKQLGSNYIRDGVCIAFMVNELLSIIENAGLMGIPIPKVITNAIEVLKSNGEHK